jgi:hypothetical protein
MSIDRTPVHFIANYGSEKYELQTSAYEYRNLMALLFEKFTWKILENVKGWAGAVLVRLRLRQLGRVLIALIEMRPGRFRNLESMKVMLTCRVRYWWTKIYKTSQ